MTDFDQYVERVVQANPGSEVYIDQEGAIWLLDGARCPRCPEPSRTKHRMKGSGYFLCPSCGVMYDEPHFSADDFMGFTEMAEQYMEIKYGSGA